MKGNNDIFIPYASEESIPLIVGTPEQIKAAEEVMERDCPPWPSAGSDSGVLSSVGSQVATFCLVALVAIAVLF